MNKLKDKLFTEKYRPTCWEDLICEHKDLLKKYCKNPDTMPSFIFVGKPGNGKTSTANIIANSIGADMLKINASDERSIETIRDKVKNFAENQSSISDVKRLVFLDEASGLTKIAQEAMKVIMEEFSDNCFFILNSNDESGIIEPIRKGRTIVLNFDKPPKKSLEKLLVIINNKENLNIELDDIDKIIKYNYPDIRSMVMTLNRAKIEGNLDFLGVSKFGQVLKYLSKNDFDSIYKLVQEGNFNIMGFLRFYADIVFENDEYEISKKSKIIGWLVDAEKNYQVGLSLEICFLNAMLKVINLND